MPVQAVVEEDRAPQQVPKGVKELRERSGMVRRARQQVSRTAAPEEEGEEEVTSPPAMQAKQEAREDYMVAQEAQVLPSQPPQPEERGRRASL